MRYLRSMNKTVKRYVENTTPPDSDEALNRVTYFPPPFYALTQHTFYDSENQHDHFFFFFCVCVCYNLSTGIYTVTRIAINRALDFTYVNGFTSLVFSSLL